MTISSRRALTLMKQIERLLRGGRAPAPRKRSSRPRPTAQRSSTKSDEFLLQIWTNLRTEYFPDRPELDTYIVAWSSRSQKRVLASCNIRQRKVVVARELFEPSACRWISPVLYHELCHAVIGEEVRVQRGKRQWHGSEFRALEARHPDIEAMNAWIRSGGWAMAVRSNRSRRAWETRRAAND
jgi:hypothetical protein